MSPTVPTEESSERLTGDITFTSPLPSSVQYTITILNTLKAQHLALTTSLHHWVRVEPAYDLRGSPLPITTKEASTFPAHSRNASFTTTTGDSLVEWYDAPDGPEEFFMGIDEHEPAELVASTDDQSIYHSEGGSGEDTDTVEDIIKPQDQKYDELRAHHQDPTQVVRRSELPAIIASDEGSLFAILKNNVGKARLHYLLLMLCSYKIGPINYRISCVVQRASDFVATGCRGVGIL